MSNQNPKTLWEHFKEGYEGGKARNQREREVNQAKKLSLGESLLDNDKTDSSAYKSSSNNAKSNKK